MGRVVEDAELVVGIDVIARQFGASTGQRGVAGAPHVRGRHRDASPDRVRCAEWNGPVPVEAAGQCAGIQDQPVGVGDHRRVHSGGREHLVEDLRFAFDHQLGQFRRLECRHVPGSAPLVALRHGCDEGRRMRDGHGGQRADQVGPGGGEHPRHLRAPVVADEVHARRVGLDDHRLDVGHEFADAIRETSARTSEGE